MSAAGGLEELDRIACGVVYEDLLPAGAGDDVVAEAEPRLAEPRDLALDVVDDQVDPVPAAWLRDTAVGHGAAGGARRPAQQQPQRPAHDVGERRRVARAQLKPEVLRVEADGALDVVDEVADAHELVRHGLPPASGSSWPEGSRCGRRGPPRPPRTPAHPRGPGQERSSGSLPGRRGTPGRPRGRGRTA